MLGSAVFKAPKWNLAAIPPTLKGVGFLATKAVNVPSFDKAREVLMCGRKSGREIDKFKEANFTVEKGRVTDTPIIKVCVTHIECRVANISKMGDHMLIAGEVCAVYASNEVFDKMYKLDKHRPLLHVGGDLFATTQRETIRP